MSYPGGKNGAGVYQTIINLMPPHEVYIEPFLGGAAVMRAKRPALLNIGCDLDRTALEAARAAALAGNGEARVSTVAPMAEGLAAINDERRRRSARPAMLAAAGGIGAGGDGGPQHRFLWGNGIELLRSYPFSGAELVYCDPPYVRSARSSPRNMYRFEMSDVDHRQLSRVLQDLPCLVMLSGYWSRLYADALEGWRHVTFQSMTRGGHPATEWLWFNFAEPLELHDYRYLGRNFRERERIKRKKQRWVGRLLKMPLLERQALIAAIGETACRCAAAEPRACDSNFAIADNAGGGEATRSYSASGSRATPRASFFSDATAGRGSGKFFVTSQQSRVRTQESHG